MKKNVTLWSGSASRKIVLQAKKFRREHAGFLRLLSGSVLSQLILILALPLITRLYAPEELGMYLVIYSVSAIFGAISTMRLESAIYIAADEAEAKRLMTTATILTVLLSLVVLPILLSILVWWSNSSLTKTLFYGGLLAIINAFLLGSRAIVYAHALRCGKTRLVSRSLILRSMTLVIVQLVLGIFYLGVIGLLAAEMLGTLCMVVFLLYHGEKPQLRSIKRIRADLSLFNWQRYRRFIFYETPSILISEAVARLPIWAVTWLFGSTQTGIFGIAYQIVQLPNRHIGGNMGDIVQMEAGKLTRQGAVDQLMGLIKAKTKLLMLVAIGPLVLTLLLAPTVFPLVLGAKWTEAGSFAQAISPWMFAALIVPTVARVLLVVERQDMKLIYDAMIFLSMSSLFAYCYYVKASIITTLWMLSFMFGIAYAIYYWFILRAVKSSSSRWKSQS